MPSADAIVRSIECEFDVVSPHSGRISDYCNQLKSRLGTRHGAVEQEHLARLVALVRNSLCDGASAVFDFLVEQVRTAPHPWPILQGMLGARNPDLSLRAHALVLELIDSGQLTIDRLVLDSLAAKVCASESDSSFTERLSLIRRLLEADCHRASRDFADALRTWYLTDQAMPVRRMAALLLDEGSATVPEETARMFLGDEAFAFLWPYLSFSRATHRDLLSLHIAEEAPPPLLGSLRAAESVCDPRLLREVVAELGWERVSLGIRAERVVGVRVGESLPFTLRPDEAFLFNRCDGVEQSSVYYVFVGHGEPSARGDVDARQIDQITRFRAYNLAHAEVLIDILDDAPLTVESARRIIDRMDRIVADFVALFSVVWADTAILPSVYSDLRTQLTSLLDSQQPDSFASAEVSRLVRMFEDPKSLGMVRTIHGLKRFLHQQGLALGMKLPGARVTNRNVDLLLVDGRERTLVRAITYADFESEDAEEHPLPAVPAPVQVVVDAYRRQLLYGCRSLPRTDIYCYGNEVHYYLNFRNHPAFLRIDFSPPLYGGMIDLEYYGVSKYELAAHPNVRLDHLQRFLQTLNLDVTVDTTRVRARCDKERAVRLDDIRSTAAALMCFVPYLMDLDWVIGSLALSCEEKQVVCGAWADRFARWHVLPLNWILSENRQGIVTRTAAGPTGLPEVLWRGGRIYEDRFPQLEAGSLAESIGCELAGVGIACEREGASGLPGEYGQVDLERAALNPVREAIARGQLDSVAGQLRRRPASLHQQLAGAEFFADMLAAGGQTLADAANVASIISQLDHLLVFTTTGHVNGHDVENAPLPLAGRDLQVHVLRDKLRAIRLAVYTQSNCLHRSRENPDEPWRESASVDGPTLARLLRRNNYPFAARGDTIPLAPGDLKNLVSHFDSPLALAAGRGSAERRIITGIGAAPGRAFGRALFRQPHHEPEDFHDAILLSPTVSPNDSRFLYCARGVVSTGGGVLSHAGLLAAQFQKPALIIPGRWENQDDGKMVLIYACQEYAEVQMERDGYTIGLRQDIQTREHQLRNGDLIALDANRRTLTVLGQHPDTVALCDSLQQLGNITSRLLQASNDHQILTLRGHRLTILHQFGRVAQRLTDPLVAEHAIVEILLSEDHAPGPSGTGERAQLIGLFLQNPTLRDHTRAALQRINHECKSRYDAAREEATRTIPESDSLAEILALRLRFLRQDDLLNGLNSLLQSYDIPPAHWDPSRREEIERLTWIRLTALRTKKREDCERFQDDNPLLRHRLRLLRQLMALLGEDSRSRQVRSDRTKRLARSDALRIRALRSCWVIRSEFAGYELAPFIGWKAAHLAEIERLGASGLVPPWFVITESARSLMLGQTLQHRVSSEDPAAGSPITLGEAIRALDTSTSLDAREKSRRIAALWESVTIPEELSRALLDAYHRLVDSHAVVSAGPHAERAFVALRSSTCEEDAESASRAGEFDTFLFVSGDELFLSRLRHAWAGFWTERALLSREVLGVLPEQVSGGVVVQAMIRSRVSGVLQTVNVAEGAPDEIIVNATLGIGEGIVSGVTAADHIVVEKRAVGRPGPLTFRYLTLDKSEQVVFDKRSGNGTQRVPSLFHRRLRPALEYSELVELVSLAVRLEQAYGYPIDMEFALDDRSLWILQVRPVASFIAGLRESVVHFPLREPVHGEVETAERR